MWLPHASFIRGQQNDTDFEGTISPDAHICKYFQTHPQTPKRYNAIPGPVAELADAADLKSAGVKPMWVRVPPGPFDPNRNKSGEDAGTGKMPGPCCVSIRLCLCPSSCQLRLRRHTTGWISSRDGRNRPISHQPEYATGSRSREVPGRDRDPQPEMQSPARESAQAQAWRRRCHTRPGAQTWHHQAAPYAENNPHDSHGI